VNIFFTKMPDGVTYPAFIFTPSKQPTMNTLQLSVREIQASDIPLITQYWMGAEPDFLLAMGVDLAKMPMEHEWQDMLNEQLNTPHPHKKSWCMIWLIDGEPSGHSNINKIIPGEEAYMHLHLWKSNSRKRGTGAELVKMTVPYFFKTYDLKRLYCEPYAKNDAPNNTLRKAGFEFVRQEITIPGWLNFEQPVNLWVMTKEKLLETQ
jgi:RimJ/RimL family protein N-acetyltransferase